MANRQVINPVTPQVGLQVAAQPSLFNPVPSGADADMQGLIKGLSMLHPALEKYQAAKDDAQSLALQAEAVKATQAGVTDAHRFTGDLKDLAANGLPVPAEFNPAVSPAYSSGVAKGTGERLGQSMADDYENDFSQKVNDLNFLPQVKDHYQQSLSAALQGVSSPEVQAEVVKHFEKAYSKTSQKATVLGIEQSKNAATVIIHGGLSDIVNQVQGGSEAQFSQYLQRQEDYRAFGGFYTRNDINKMFLDTLEARSVSLGGAPEVFDVMTNHALPGLGKSIADVSGLSDEVAKLKQAAQTMRDKQLDKDKQVANGQLTMTMETGWKQGKFMPDDFFLNQIGTGKLYSDDSQALTAWRRQTQAMEKYQEEANIFSIVAEGQGGTLSEAQQTKAIDAISAHIGQVLRESFKPNQPGATDWHAVNTVMEQAVRFGGANGADKQIPIVKSLINAPAQSVPSTAVASVPEQFQLGYNTWRAMPTGLRTQYTSQDADTLYRAFDHLVNDERLDQPSAYIRAYQGITPEAKAMAERLRSDPAERQRIKEAASAAFGSYWLPRFAESWAGMQPTNVDNITELMKSKVIEWRSLHPNATQEQTNDYAESVTQHYVLFDKENSRGIVLPTPTASPVLQDALAEATAKLKAKYPQRTSDGWTVGYDVDHQGVLHPQVFYNGEMSSYLINEEALTPQQMNDNYRHARQLTPADATVLGQLTIKAIKGTLSAEDLTQQQATIAKAQKYDFLSEPLKQAMSSRKEANFSLLASTRLSLAMGSAPATIPQQPPKANTAQPSVLRQVAGELYQSDRPGMALTAMRENLVLKATQDPNKAAGKNIGFGYNLSANEATLEKDFMAAGIPRERIGEVKAGTASITPDQAKNLLKVAYPRYEKLAESAVNRVKTNGWSLLSATDRAVLTDIAYQVGDPGQFRNTITNMLAGEGEQAQMQGRVYYSKDGKKVEDTHGNSWRSNFYQNPNSFSSFIMKATQ